MVVERQRGQSPGAREGSCLLGLFFSEWSSPSSPSVWRARVDTWPASGDDGGSSLALALGLGDTTRVSGAEVVIDCSCVDGCGCGCGCGCGSG